MATRALFDQELAELNSELTEMSFVVQKAIEDSLDALERHDVEKAEQIINGDRAVDRMERKIESRCLSLMLRQSPVARDLRHISAALKVVTDLERIGDHAADIAELTLQLKDASSCRAAEHLLMMGAEVQDMVRDAIRAFIERDVRTAEQFDARDDVIDAFFDQVKAEVIGLLKADAENPDLAVDLLMIAKYLERIGDHAVNVCEWAQFNDTGNVGETLLL